MVACAAVSVKVVWKCTFCTTNPFWRRLCNTSLLCKGKYGHLSSCARKAVLQKKAYCCVLAFYLDSFFVLEGANVLQMAAETMQLCAGWRGGGVGALSRAMGVTVQAKWFWFPDWMWINSDAQAGDAVGSALVFHFKMCRLKHFFSVGPVKYKLGVWWALVKKRDYCNDITAADFLEQLSLQKQICFASAVSSSSPSVENNTTPLKTKWGLFLLKLTAESIFLCCLLRLLNCCLILTSGLKAFQENKHV